MDATLDLMTPLRGVALLCLFVFFAKDLRDAVRKHAPALLPAFTGLAYGGIAVIGMLTPIVVVPDGVKSDPRVPMVAIAGLLGGPIAASIAVVMAAAMRIGMGGIGLLPGILALVGGGAIGAALSRGFHADLERWGFTRFVLLGLALAAQGLANCVFLPEGMRWSTFLGIGPLTVFMYTLATVVAGMLEHGTLTRRLDQERLIQGAKLASLGELAGQIVHEINNPLMAVKMQLAILLRHHERTGPLDAKRDQLLGGIGEAVDRIADIAGDLRRYIRNEPPRCEEFASGEVVARSVDLMRKVAGPRRSDIVLHETLSATILGDPRKLEQIMVNLIANALQATEGLPKPEIRVEVGSDATTVRISVSDNGIGIAADVLPRVFDRYTSKVSGTGIGLGVCKIHVEAMGGKIHVESTLGRGSRFVLTLPVVARMTKT